MPADNWMITAFYTQLRITDTRKDPNYMKYKAVIFDLDGLLLDTEIVAFKVYEELEFTTLKYKSCRQISRPVL